MTAEDGDVARNHDALQALLRWYADMGVDAAIDEEPHDRFADPERERPRSAPAQHLQPMAARESPPAHATGSAEALTRQAEALAAAAPDLETLRAAWECLPGCGLAATASRMIFAGGAPGSILMVIGGAPDSDDERQGEIFAGAAGRLLDGMLGSIGLDRTRVYLANVVPWRPPGNRPPTPLELALCLPFTRRHIELATPRLILCLGERAAQPLLGSRDPVSRLRGRWLSFEGETILCKTLVSFSPEYLLKQPLQKRRAWGDLQMLAAELH